MLAYAVGHRSRWQCVAVVGDQLHGYVIRAGKMCYLANLCTDEDINAGLVYHMRSFVQYAKQRHAASSFV